MEHGENAAHGSCSCPAPTAQTSSNLSRRLLLGGGAAVGAGALLTASGIPGAAASPAPGSRRPEPDWTGTSVVLLGTSAGPLPTFGRNMTSQAVVVDGATYVIDCGNGVVRQIVNAGIPYGSIRNLFITHLHSDHVSDYLPTVLFGRKIGPTPGFERTVDVYGPGRAGALPAGVPPAGVTPVRPSLPTPGTVDMHNGLLEAAAYTVNQMYIASATGPDIRDLVIPHDIVLPSAPAAGPRGPFDPAMRPFAVFEDDRVKVSATLVHHPPVFPAFAFRFDTDQGSIVFSGDTAPSRNLIELAHGADLLVHEVQYSQQMLAHGTPAPFVTFLRSLHTDVTELGPIAAEASVGALALSHIASVQLTSAYPETLSDHAWTAPIRPAYGKSVFVGQDLMRLSVVGGRVKRR